MANIGTQLTKPEEGWKRIDETHDGVIWTGFNRKSYTGSYGGYILQQVGNPSGRAKVAFRFYGTKIRIICRKEMYWNDGMKISIDGEEATYSLSGWEKNSVLVYQKEGLALKTHTVIISGTVTAYESVFDCFDIEEDAYVIPLDGTENYPTLPYVEEGWMRYDSIEDVFSVSGNWVAKSNVSGYNELHYLLSSKNKDEIKFSFTGDRLRIISEGLMNYSGDVRITLDGVTKKIDCNKFTFSNKLAVIYERTALDPNKTHTCIITNRENASFIFDAVDISKDGEMLPALDTNFEFPIGVIEAEELEGYCRSLINGEEQILITPEGDIFLTNGDRGYVEIGITKEKLRSIELRLIALEESSSVAAEYL